jgi:hypothetical protein
VYVLTDSRVKAALIPALVLNLQLLAANCSPICAQVTNHPTSITSSSVPSVSTLDTSSTNRTDQNYLTQLRTSIARDSNKAGPLRTEVGDEIDQLEWTGQYVERYVRVPEGNSGKAKLIRFLIPVYREKGTQRKISVGTEDKQKN